MKPSLSKVNHRIEDVNYVRPVKMTDANWDIARDEDVSCAFVCFNLISTSAVMPLANNPIVVRCTLIDCLDTNWARDRHLAWPTSSFGYTLDWIEDIFVQKQCSILFAGGDQNKLIPLIA